MSEIETIFLSFCFSGKRIVQEQEWCYCARIRPITICITFSRSSTTREKHLLLRIIPAEFSHFSSRFETEFRMCFFRANLPCFLALSSSSSSLLPNLILDVHTIKIREEHFHRNEELFNSLKTRVILSTHQSCHTCSLNEPPKKHHCY